MDQMLEGVMSLERCVATLQVKHSTTHSHSPEGNIREDINS